MTVGARRGDEVTRVLIVDDETLVRHALRIFVDGADDMTVVGEAVDAEEAIGKARRRAPDVVLMDVQMPGDSGVDATRHITATAPDVRVLALASFPTERHVTTALRAGASGYLVKDTAPDDILRGIRDVRAGRPVFSPCIARKLARALECELGPRHHDASGAEHLTDRELSVVQLIARGMSNAEIARHLHVAEPTVKAALGRVMRKWRVRDRVQVLLHAIAHGFVDVDVAGRSSEAARSRIRSQRLRR